MKLTIVTIVLFGLMVQSPEKCESYRILGMFPLPLRSHFTMFGALFRGLAQKGHQVDMVSPFPLKKSLPNYTDITVPSIVPTYVNNMSYENLTKITNNLMALTVSVGNSGCEDFGRPEIQRIIKNPPNDPPYDLVITEVCAAHCYIALGHHLKVPVIGVSSSNLYPWGNPIIGNPHNFAFVSNNLINYIAPMTFSERLHNMIHAIYSDWYFRYYTDSQQSDAIKKYLGNDAPSVREAEKNLALILTNTHPALNGPKPITPALIEVGGLHVQDDDVELPLDLIKWMDDSTEGFIYFTFGSMVTIETFPEETIRIFYKSLGKIAPMRVLIKIPNPKKLPSALPNNFRTFSWVSQYKVLKHKNVKAFITHGGLMGTQEALHFAVPMIGIPLFADQFINVDICVHKKIAIKLNYANITEKSMDEALNEILHNPEYKNTMRKISVQFLDRPMSAMDTATWWVEYVIRNGGDGLRSPALDLFWWQIELIDVYAFISVIVAFSIFVTITLVRFLIKIYVRFSSSKAIRSKKIK